MAVKSSLITLPQISLADHVLSSSVPLPLDSSVSYALFKPILNSTAKPHESIEIARRNILTRNGLATLADSLLSSIHIGVNSFMYVFLVSPQDRIPDSISTLAALNFDGLTVAQTSSYALNGLYPCSSGCSLLPMPCPSCTDRFSSSPYSLLPRKPLRIIHSYFLEAVRIRLLDDVSKASTKNATQRQVKRLKGGFLLCSPSSTSEWGASWEYRALSKPLLYCQLQIHFSQEPTPRFLIHPLLLPTHFLPLGYSLPVPPGTPITLLPHGTPAFFLTHYSGPTSALTKQFQESLLGMGVSGWDSSSSNPTGFVQTGFASNPEFIIAWINVENKQGEDKGIMVIYPTTLCLSFVPSPLSVPARQPLSFIPELPAPLQPSPQVPTTLTSPVRIGTPSMIIPPNIPAFTSPSTSTYPSFSSFFPVPHPVVPRSPTTEALRSFQTLKLSKSRDIRRVAAEVGGYVDAVARERERERERLKREREGGTSSSPRLARTVAATPVAPTPTTTIATDAPTSLLTTPIPSGGSGSHALAGPSQSHHLTSSQNFYPSPPQTNQSIVHPPQGGPTSPAVNPQSISTTASTTIQSSESPTPVAPLAVASSSSAPPPGSASFDPFGSGDSSWSMQPQPYLGMDMDMDFDMDMGMGMGFSMNAGGRGGTYDSGPTGMDFDESAFTDDDFSFFDQPSDRGAAPASAPQLSTARGMNGLSSSSDTSTSLPPASSSALTGMSLGPSPLFPSDLHLSGPTPQQMPTPHSHALHSPWVPSTAGDSFTPRFSTDIAVDGGPIPPDLLPPSPGQTPSSHSAPATPSIHLEWDPAIRPPSSGGGTVNFDPIPFAAYHRALDGKYAIGKFSLPSPPDEEDRTEPFTPTRQLDASYFPKYFGTNMGPVASKGWRSKYIAATDPRVGVVTKLIGKRKSPFDQGGRDAGGIAIASGSSKMSPAWIREHEDWEKCGSPDTHKFDNKSGETHDNDDDTKSDVESDDDYEDMREDSESPVVSRPSTPPPLYLPLGPTLLHTQFHHSELLPLSTPLRPPGAAVAPTNMIAATPIPSVPTPVSPAATLGASSEKSKSLEAAAFTVATEVVENPPWAEAWRASTVIGSKYLPEVWLGDVRSILNLFGAVPGLEGPLDLNSLFDLGGPDSTTPTSNPKKALQMLEAPMISIGKGTAVIQILPTALRFWEKLGLGPRGGKKNSTTYVLFEDDGEQRLQQAETWLASVVTTYEGQHFGKLTLGKSSFCPKDGLVPLRFDSSFRKSLASFIASLPASQSGFVFFIVTPISTMSLASPILRQVFSAVKKATKTYSEAQIHFQLVPEQLIQGSLGNPAADFSDLEILSCSLYNRILIPVDRLMSRRLFEHGERVRKYFQEPAMTLARPLYNKVSFARVAHAPLDVMDRNTFLHVGYQVSPCGKWILAACVDQRGEAHDLGVWLTQTSGEGETDGEISQEMFLVTKVWEFAKAFAKKANVEWRMVFAKLGSMGESELDAWTSFLSSAIGKHRSIPAIHVTVLCAETDAPWTFCSSRPQPKSPSAKSTHLSRSLSMSKGHHPQNVFTDITTTIYTTSPYTNLPQSVPPAIADLGLPLSFIPESPCSPMSESTTGELQSPFPHPLPLLPRSTTTIICIPVSPSPTAITMLHTHLLYIARSPASSVTISTPQELATLHTDITRNFHDLAVLANTRWRLNVNPALPFHLAAVEAMRIALDLDQYAIDGTDA